MHAAEIFGYDLQTAIEDMDRSIEMDPDRGLNYRLRGEFLLMEHCHEPDYGRMRSNWEVDISDCRIKEVIADYKTALEKSPTDHEAWLALIELNILLHDWDEAISNYGSCRPFIKSRKDELVRSWLGCLALVLAGDPVEEDDKGPLYDQTIRSSLVSQSDRMQRIISDSFMRGIEKKEEYKEKWEKAVEINKLYVEHLDDWEVQGDMLEKLGYYRDAVDAYSKAIESKPENAYQIYKKKGDILYQFLFFGCELVGKFKQGNKFYSFLRHYYEEALQAYEGAIKTGTGASDVQLWYRKATLLNYLKRYEEAVNAFNKVEEIDTGDYRDELWLRQGSLLEKLGRYEEALNLLNLHAEKVKKDDIIEALDLKCNLLGKLGRHAEADEVLTEARKARSARAEEFYKSACESAQKGQISGVTRRLRDAIEIDAAYKDKAKNDEVFKVLWNDLSFKTIVE
jgi:tetratricopeptide (TPR) repeat protein